MLQPIPPKAPVLRRRLLLVFVNLVVPVALAEGVILLMLGAPGLTARSPHAVRHFIQQVYRHFDRTLIQFEPHCARYDPEVTYTLRPGTCVFSNVEFDNDFSINHVGLRDDEASLEGPDVIVLGDSHAMGWGVDQRETFAEVLQRRSGLKVLNAAVSSYATVREMRMLDRLDTSRLKVLIVQYSDNDSPENLTFRNHGNQLTIMREAQYERIVRYAESTRRYYPGKYMYRLGMKALRLEAPEPFDTSLTPVTPIEEAELFVNALTHAGHTRLEGVQVIALEVCEKLDAPLGLVAALDGVKANPAYPACVQTLRTLDTAPLLTPAEFYALDDHMRPRGHEIVAEALLELIKTVVPLAPSVRST